MKLKISCDEKATEDEIRWCYCNYKSFYEKYTKSWQFSCGRPLRVECRAYGFGGLVAIANEDRIVCVLCSKDSVSFSFKNRNRKMDGKENKHECD